ncbi:hypothetical protein JJB11_21460 [Ramlibacter ginsenosidimutans]|uniref:Helix-turn-helix domain-containing protein n=1 Tax=Ramlibacter ginsenosidimutans TaxID=502333 RepID=A0A934TXX5_9BURK|nr:hypothetical protein [Ramlibacter ginsenosidimutans]MBK6008677.1 hypothetical protein [Ramlibacter ginsenosidimutans]
MSKVSRTALALRQVPLRPGMTLVTMDSEEHEFHARYLIERHAAEGSDKLGIPFPEPRRVVSLHAGTPRSFEQIRLLAELCAAGRKEPRGLERRHIGRQGFDPCRDEGIGAVLGELTGSTKALVCFEQPVSDPLPNHVIEGLTRFKQLAVSAASHIVVFTKRVSAPSRLQLERLADEVIDVEACEPEAGARHSFHIRWHGALHLDGLNHGTVMCSVRVAQDRYVYKADPFVAKDLSGRVMWMLRCEGWQLEAIAKLVGVNRSTVKRRLDQMPPTRELDLAEGWLERYRDALDLPGAEAI